MWSWTYWRNLTQATFSPEINKEIWELMQLFRVGKSDPEFQISGDITEEDLEFIWLEAYTPCIYFCQLYREKEYRESEYWTSNTKTHFRRESPLFTVVWIRKLWLLFKNCQNKMGRRRLQESKMNYFNVGKIVNTQKIVWWDASLVQTDFAEERFKKGAVLPCLMKRTVCSIWPLLATVNRRTWHY